jgi:hypothetical protein
MEFELLKVRMLTGEIKYESLKVKMGDKYYYLAQGYVLKIKQWEYNSLPKKPCLQYCTTTLKLHFRIIDKMNKDKHISKK